MDESPRHHKKQGVPPTAKVGGTPFQEGSKYGD